ncbi:FliH/SctL family protein [Actinotalea subterranea]|uniref:FliH/SctL family protein n=1 Tax=Actinotalea subterranea TaxID=2607497 RepID=UPI0011ED4DD3|nr:FliH/SctL family protein [Actinotalea subterranea]
MSPEPTPAVVAFRPAQLAPTTTTAAAGETENRARAAGYAAGWSAGARAAADAAVTQQRRLAEQNERAEASRQAALADAMLVLERAVQATSARVVPVVDDARRAMYDAALELAAVVLQRELADGAGSVRDLLARALAVPAEVGVHTIRLNPTDLARVQDAVATGDGVPLPTGVSLVADPRLAPGDVISEYPGGFLDGQVAAALDRARRALLEDQA